MITIFSDILPRNILNTEVSLRAKCEAIIMEICEIFTESYAITELLSICYAWVTLCPILDKQQIIIKLVAKIASMGGGRRD